MNAIIIEDEFPAVKALEKLLRDSGEEISVVGTMDSVAESVKWFKKNPPPDLAFMDIQLGDGVSFEIFEKTDVPCPVIFITAFDDFAIRAFKLNSIDYLLKPVNPSELAQSLKKYNRLHAECDSHQTTDIQNILKDIRMQHQAYKSRFLIPVRDQFVSIPVEEISHFFSEHKNTYLVTRELKKHAVDCTLEKLEEELDPRLFFRTNRQYLVAYHSIAAVHTFFNGKLKTYLRGANDEIIISRERAAGFKEWLDR